MNVDSLRSFYFFLIPHVCDSSKDDKGEDMRRRQCKEGVLREGKGRGGEGRRDTLF